MMKEKIDRVFYFNILLACNNKCKFCLSPASYNGKNGIMRSENILEIINRYKINNKDRVVINGGEPTIHPEINQIFRLFKETHAEIVLYSNGRKFSDDRYVDIVKSNGIKRITIPIHGDRELHNIITNRKSFDETIKGINNLLKNLDDNIKLEIKFIVNNKFIERNIDIFEIINCNIKNKNIDSVIFAGLVENLIARKNDITLNWEKAGDYISKQIEKLCKKIPDLKIKFEDIQFCKLDKNIQEDIRKKYNEELNDKFREFYVFDYKHLKGNSIPYKINKCLKNKENTCEKFKFCGSIMESYMVIAYEKNTVYLEME